MPDERAIVRASAPLTPESDRRRANADDSPWREDAHAVVIGINEYVDPKIPNLRFARADAEAIYNVLIDPEIGRFKPDNVTLLVDDKATERNIRSALGTQLPRRAGRESTVIIYYAGHGAPVVDARSRSVDGLEKYLIPHDAVADDLRASGISMDSVQQYFSWLDASQVICFLDSCYSGTAGGRSFDHPAYQTRAMLSDEFLDSLASEGRFIVTACAMNEVSLEDSKKGHGIFTQRLVEGLRGAADANGDGKVTIDELYEYVYKNVESDARALGGSMNPVKKGSVQGKIYLTEYETETRKRVRQVLQAASEAHARGDHAATLVLCREVLALDPTNADALEKTAAALAVEQRRAAEVKRQERLLLGHVNSGDLTMRDYNRALSSLEGDTTSLAPKELQYRRLVDALIAGELTIRSFNRSAELLDSETAEHEQPAPTPAPAAPPQISVPRPAAVAPPAPKETVASSPKPPVAKPPVVPNQPPGLSPGGGLRKFLIIGGLAVGGVIAFLVLRPRRDPVQAEVDAIRNATNGSSAAQRALDSLKEMAPAAQSAPQPSSDVATRSASPSASSTKTGRTRAPETVSQPVVESQPQLPPFGLVSNNPAHNGGLWALDGPITLRFDLAPDDQIDLASLSNRLNITGGGISFPPNVEQDGPGLRIDHATFHEATWYTLTMRAGVRSKLGRVLASDLTIAFETAVVDTAYFYRLTNARTSVAVALTADAKSCRMEGQQSGGNQAWYFTRSLQPDYFVMHNASGGDATGLEGAASPDVCLLAGAGSNPPTGMLWKIVPVNGVNRSFFLQNMNFGQAQSLSMTPGGPMMQATAPQDGRQWWILQRQQRR